MNLPPPRRCGDASVPTMVFAVAASARIAYLLIFRPPLESSYLALADGMLGSGVLGAGGTPSTAFEPMYPALLAIGRWLFGDRTLAIQAMQACIAASGAPLMYHLAMRLTSSQRTATAAGLMFACHPLLIRQASAPSDLGLTTTLLVTFAVSFVAIHDERNAAVAGAWVGFTVLTRSMTVPIVVLSAAVLAVQRQTREALALAVVAVVFVAPLAARNYALSGVPWPGRSGINLYIGNSAYTGALLPTYDLDLLEPEAHNRFVRACPDAGAEVSNPEFDAFLTREAIDYIAANPWKTARQKVLNVAFMLSPRIAPYKISGPNTRVRIEGDRVLGVDGGIPRHLSETASHAVTMCVLLVGCAAGVYRRRREVLRRDAVLWAIFVTFAVINAIYVPATRYTAPMQFVLIFYAAVAFARLEEGSRDAAVA